MSELLNFEDAYNEAQYFRNPELQLEDYDSESDWLDEMRCLLEALDNRTLIELHTEASLDSEWSENDETLNRLTGVIITMPYIDHERAFGFFEQVIDEHKDIHPHTVNDAIVFGLKSLTLTGPEKSLQLWRKIKETEKPDLEPYVKESVRLLFASSHDNPKPNLPRNVVRELGVILGKSEFEQQFAGSNSTITTS